MTMVVDPTGPALESGASGDPPLMPDRTSAPRTVPPMTRTTDEVADTDEPGLSLGDRGAFALLEYRDGRPHALGEFVREATPLLWHTVRAQGVEREQADDIVQTVWVALVRNAMTIKEPHAVLKWLLITAKRAAWEAVRKHRDEAKRRTELPDDTEEGVPELPSGDPTPDVEVLRNERDRTLWAALDQLPDRCRRLLRLVSLADRPDYKAISAAIGMPVGSIGSTRGRCLAKLRDIIDDQGESWEAS